LKCCNGPIHNHLTIRAENRASGAFHLEDSISFDGILNTLRNVREFGGGTGCSYIVIIENARSTETSNCT